MILVTRRRGFGMRRLASFVLVIQDHSAAGQDALRHLEDDSVARLPGETLKLHVNAYYFGC